MSTTPQLTILPTPVGPGWFSTGAAARMWGKSDQTVRRWCETGYLLELNFQVHRDSMGRWWIRANEPNICNIPNAPA